MEKSIRCNLCESCKMSIQSAQYFNQTEECDILIVRETATATEYKSGKLSGKDVQIIKDELNKMSLGEDLKIDFIASLGCYIKKKSGANPYPKEVISNCHKKLKSLIIQKKPKFVIVCGATALKVITGDLNLKIKSEYAIERTYENLGYGGIRFFPTLNPGILIHAPKEYKNLVHHMHILSDLIKGNESLIDCGITEYEVLDTDTKIDGAIKFLYDQHAQGNLHWASYDIETTSLDYRKVDYLVGGISYAKNKAFVIPRELRYRYIEFIKDVPWKNIWQHGENLPCLNPSQIGELCQMRIPS